jgi:hypothetical protein
MFAGQYVFPQPRQIKRVISANNITATTQKLISNGIRLIKKKCGKMSIVKTAILVHAISKRV